MNLFIKPHAGRYFSMEAMQKIKCLTIEDSNFPDRLRKLSGMPKKLYYIGNLPDPKKPAAAVVGARMCSPYGRCQAFKYARTMQATVCRSSVEWQEELMQRGIKVHWIRTLLLLQCWEAEWTCVIPIPTDGFISGSWKKAAGSSASFPRALRL